MNSIHSIIEEIAEMDHNTQAVKATIIKVKGSAYRKEGATMLFFEGGKQIGTLSAGCLERALQLEALSLMKTVGGGSKTVVYDMSAEDDLSWGRGAGCNGKIHILLEVISQEMLFNIHMLRQYLMERKYISVITIFKKDMSVDRTIYVTENFIFGQSIPDYLHGYIYGLLQVHTRNKLLVSKQLSAKGFIHHYHPKPRLFIFGAGPDARPLSSFASMTGFSVYVWDWRQNYLLKEKLATATILPRKPIDDLINHIQLREQDFVIVMTHDFQQDQKLLRFLGKQKELQYLGILGPKRRTARLLNGTIPGGEIHSPVGLAIGAEGPEEIAVSIVAELVQVKNQLMKEVIPFDKQDLWNLSSSWSKRKVWDQ